MQLVVCRNLRGNLVDWSSLPPELLMEIVPYLQSIEDFMAFRGVCTSWRVNVAVDKFLTPLSPRIPLLMLATKGIATNVSNNVFPSTHVNFYNGRFYIMDPWINMWVWDGNLPPVVHLCFSSMITLPHQIFHMYLVKSSSSLDGGQGKLLFVIRLHQSPNRRDRVFVVGSDTVNNAFKLIDHVGGDAIFVGYNAAVSYSEAEARELELKGVEQYLPPPFKVDSVHGVDHFLNPPLWISSGP
ncbi:OLC1v1004448C1 [Oldenlandia corymbosa var. corymbosa]|uniref:OLC1v1004448C1 n=1 Tax=Oldenlandia corymbosa var. corymbosa TaxID=529605 RepID=A0AAV1DEB4_OLDCO|nr:OLC1v1004448C1 [Oldenlandia corymbosa var. corymbosa]